MMSAMAIVNIPKAFESIVVGIRFWSISPSMSPTRARPMLVVIKVICSFENSCGSQLRNPIPEFIVIITRDVATALRSVSHSSAISAGTMRNPPPAPTIPVIVPTIHHSSVVMRCFFHPMIRAPSWKWFIFLLHTMEHPAANIINPKRSNTSVHFSISPIWSGMRSTRKWREK